ncbi:MAG: GNAT family N-acetyltransferase [Nanoarchaeota archaeon]|nr:GNAT family N-acetyltransferase [Nanoarchaeota archaeon]MBU4124312.1 GNAT family N-acetyltransferase [Nanoarchaeota archaeon]
MKMKLQKITKPGKEILRLYNEFNYKDKKKRIGKFRTRRIIFSAKVDKKTVGFILANFIDYGMESFGYIEELYVDKEFRNKKIGRTLVQKTLNEFKKLKVSAVHVTTNRRNKKAQLLYQRAGFEKDKNPWYNYWFR